MTNPETEQYLAQRTPPPAAPAEPKATDKQASFMRSLLDEREIPEKNGVSGERRREVALGLLDAGDMSKKQASRVIEWLLTLPKALPANNYRPTSGKREALPDVPAGRYAVENADGELRFYKVWIGRNGFVKLYVLHGPEESALPFAAMKPILSKIAVDTRAAAIRYGHEIGACSNCGRRLTNRISRELGIGPICGGRLWDDFDDEVSATRDRLRAEGIDPDEVVEADVPAEVELGWREGSTDAQPWPSDA